MGSLSLTPNQAAGGQVVKVEVHNRPDILLSQAVSVMLTQVGVGGAIHVRAQFRNISDSELEFTIPPVGPAFNGTEIIPASYQVFVQMAGRIEESQTPIQVLATAPAPAPQPQPTPSPAPAPSSPGVTAIPIPGGAMHVSTPSGPVSVPLGTPRHIQLASSTSPAAIAGKSQTQVSHCGCGSGGRQCCCKCCCSPCCDCNHSASVPPPHQPPPHIPPPPHTFHPPHVQPPLSGGGAVPGTTPASSAAGAGATGPSVASEMKVRWLVESSAPIRTGPGPEFIDVSTDPEIFSDTMSGTTPNGGQIPIEPEVDPASSYDPAEPPVRDYNFIVSSQILSPDNQVIPGQKITFRFIDPQDLRGDSSQILEVSNDLSALKKKLADDETPTGSEFAYADTEGKAYAWVRIRLYDEGQIADFSLRLKGIKAIIGEAVQPPPTVGLHSVTRPTPQSMATSARLQQQQRSLFDVLVDVGEQAVESFGEWVDGQLEAVAGIPRTFNRVLGFLLKRIADAILVMFPLPGIMAAASGQLEELRATVIGVLLGVPRGIYAMGRDTLQDLQTIFISLPKALFNFIASDPKFALQVLGAIANPLLGKVTYDIDPEFRNKINVAFSKFKGFLQKVGEVLATVWTAMKDRLTFSGITAALGTYLYNDFDKFIGFIGTDYLAFAKDGAEYRHFVGGFIAGDVLGYVLITIGVELLLAWFTAGAGNIVSIMSKFGRLGVAAGQVIRLIQRFLQFIRKVQDMIGQLVGTVFRTAKQGLGTVFMAIFRLLNAVVHPLGEHLIMPIIRALGDMAEAIQGLVARMLANFSVPENLSGAKLEQLGFALVDSIPTNSTRKLDDLVADALEVTARTADEHPSFVRFDCQCI